MQTTSVPGSLKHSSTTKPPKKWRLNGAIGYVLGHVRGRNSSPSGFAYHPSFIGIYFEGEPGPNVKVQ
jgi:hypothetical protein